MDKYTDGDSLDTNKEELDYVLQVINMITSDEDVFSQSEIKALMNDRQEPDLLSSFAKQDCSWLYVGPGTAVMTEICLPTSLYTIPTPIYRHIVKSIQKDSAHFAVCLFRSSPEYSEEFLVIISFGMALIHQGRQQAELMFVRLNGISIPDVKIPDLKLQYLTEIRRAKFKINQKNFNKCLMLILATDISASLIYIYFKDITLEIAKVEQRAVEVFHRARVLFDYFKQEIKYDFDETVKLDCTLNVVNVKLAQEDLQLLHAAILTQQKRVKDHFFRNSILLHKIHKAVRDLYQLQSDIRKDQKELEGLCAENSLFRKKYESLNEMRIREGQIRLDLELLHLQAKENKSVMEIICRQVRRLADEVDKRRFKSINCQQNLVMLAESGV